MTFSEAGNQEMISDLFFYIYFTPVSLTTQMLSDGTFPVKEESCHLATL